MSEGVYMLERVRARCVEDGDCWIWQGVVSACGSPRFAHTSARRAMWIALMGPLQARQLVSATCGSKRCMNPEHFELRNKSEVTRAAHSPAVRLKKSKSMPVVARQKGKLTLEAVAEIRSSTATLKELGAKFGVHFSLIGRVRNGQAWREYANPFSGLGARHA